MQVTTGDLLKEFIHETALRITALDKDRTLTHPVREARKKEAQRSLNKLMELSKKLTASMDNTNAALKELSGQLQEDDLEEDDTLSISEEWKPRRCINSDYTLPNY